MKFLGLCGSLRRQSFNRQALHAAQGLVPEGVELEIAGIDDIPLFNDDLRRDGDPAPVTLLKARCSEASAIVIAMPEYNYSVPGVLKNTLDWLSRPPAPPFDGKPVAIMGASTGMLGTARGQYHLRQVLQFMNTFTLNKPEVFIGQAAQKFDPEGNLTDPVARDLIAGQLAALKALVHRLG